jgi:transcriptional regulator GlxA family with amidase domain
VNSVEFLARKRAIAGRQVVVHWNREAPLREKYPDIQLRNTGYAIDGGLYTAVAGSSSAENLFLDILSEDFGTEFATHVADMLYVDTTRSCNSSKRRSLSARLGRQNESIARIVRLMEKHVEETLSLRDLTNMAGVSPRHAERLFRRAFGKTPLQYYLGIRLDHARRLLVYSDLTLGEVALASGFKGSSIFNKKYSQYFGMRPSEERGLLKAANQAVGVNANSQEPESRIAYS